MNPITDNDRKLIKHWNELCAVNTSVALKIYETVNFDTDMLAIHPSDLAKFVKNSSDFDMNKSMYYVAYGMVFSFDTLYDKLCPMNFSKLSLALINAYAPTE